jgi:hypothetical protein
MFLAEFLYKKGMTMVIPFYARFEILIFTRARQYFLRHSCTGAALLNPYIPQFKKTLAAEFSSTCSSHL